MPTTTNYGWTTPADTDLVKDGASAIRTLGSSVDTTVKNLNPETTLGDIAYRSSTANVNTRLALGTSLQYLRVNSGATAPEWATLVVGGMTLISTTTLTGSSISLTSIPGTYKNLQMIVRNYRPSADGAAFNVRFNSDSSANMHKERQIEQAPNTFTWDATSVRVANDVDNGTSNSLLIVNFYDYANTVTYKSLYANTLDADKTTPTSLIYYNNIGFYKSTNAITSLDLFPGSGTFTSGTVLLYGVS